MKDGLRWVHRTRSTHLLKASYLVGGWRCETKIGVKETQYSATGLPGTVLQGFRTGAAHWVRLLIGP